MTEFSGSKSALIVEGLRFLLNYPLYLLSEKTGLALAKPLSAVIHLTSKCNLNCPFCFFDKKEEFKNKLNKKQLFEFIDYLAKWGVKQVSFTGGEVILFKDFFDLVKHSKKKGLTIGFATNGTLWNEENTKRLVSEGVDRISVSIDGPKEMHDSFRGKGVFEKAVNFIDMLNKAKKEAKSNKPVIIINSLLLSKNLDFMEYLFNLAREKNAFLDVLPCLFEGSAAPLKWKPIQQKVISKLDIKDIKKLTEVINKLKELKKRHGVLMVPDELLDLIVNYYKDDNKLKNHKCRFGSYGMKFDIEGNAVMCGKFKNFGNIKENSPREIWESKLYKDVRKKMITCNDCFLNCHYIPSLKSLIKEVLTYPSFKKLLSY